MSNVIDRKFILDNLTDEIREKAMMKFDISKNTFYRKIRLETFDLDVVEYILDEIDKKLKLREERAARIQQRIEQLKA